MVKIDIIAEAHTICDRCGATVSRTELPLLSLGGSDKIGFADVGRLMGLVHGLSQAKAFQSLCDTCAAKEPGQ